MSNRLIRGACCNSTTEAIAVVKENPRSWLLLHAAEAMWSPEEILVEDDDVNEIEFAVCQVCFTGLLQYLILYHTYV